MQPIGPREAVQHIAEKTQEDKGRNILLREMDPSFFKSERKKKKRRG